MKHYSHLLKTYPHLVNLLAAASPIPQLKPSTIPVAEAITKIVVGQMLSRKAAGSIYARLTNARDQHGLTGSWQLKEADLTSAGLSRRKVQTIKSFGELYERNSVAIESWRDLDYTELNAEVRKISGLSHWSADMLAIFYFAKPDIFPESDGTLKRAQQILKEIYPDHETEPLLARPYRSYLALFMWTALDKGLLRTFGGVNPTA